MDTPTPHSHPHTSGFNRGNAITSLMDGEFVNSMTSLSMPIPKPPVGGMPCSSADRNSSSTPHASSSPASFLAAWASNLSRWSTGSVSSLNEFAISRPVANSSNRSTTPALLLWGFDRGLASVG